MWGWNKNVPPRDKSAKWDPSVGMAAVWWETPLSGWQEGNILLRTKTQLLGGHWLPSGHPPAHNHFPLSGRGRSRWRIATPSSASVGVTWE